MKNIYQNKIKEIISKFKNLQSVNSMESEYLFMNLLESKAVENLQNELILFIKNYGWVNTSEIYKEVFYIMNPENCGELKNLLLTEVKRGHLDPFWYAKWVDDIEYSLYKRTIYAKWWNSY
ncbi:MAG: hypothetical protein IPH57_11210 [Saprospiraceae bacterium]|nr:hypothetical protein [Saprospiraceae bacterium]